MKIALASDHAGYAQKEALKPLLQALGLDVHDLGTVSEASVDYPDYAARVAEAVATEGIQPDTLSSDIHVFSGNSPGRPYLTNVMGKFMASSA